MTIVIHSYIPRRCVKIVKRGYVEQWGFKLFCTVTILLFLPRRLCTFKRKCYSTKDVTQVLNTFVFQSKTESHESNSSHFLHNFAKNQGPVAMTALAWRDDGRDVYGYQRMERAWVKHKRRGIAVEDIKVVPLLSTRGKHDTRHLVQYGRGKTGFFHLLVIVIKD